MLSVVVFLSCVFAASASRCCIPPQWSGRTSYVTSIIHEGKPRFAEGSAGMAFDAINHKIGQLVSETIDGVERNLAVLMDYNTNTKYIMFDNKCYKKTLGRRLEDFGGCIPDNSTLVSNHNLLGAAADTMDYVTYKMTFSGVVSYVALTSDSCVPVMEVTRGGLGEDAFMENVHYINITAGMPSGDVLQTPPKGCENAMDFNAHYTLGSFDSSLVGRKRSLLFDF